ncbi:MAG: beta-galactosidase [Thermococcus sp.]|uniref:beta-galactosidase n=1 Tax=Thermococcus sp. TaxID=35749 RepID=UPI001D689ADC|nr:beta-galactosidase [Thermococcus sp.]MBO8173837.1 beta-galactosidase [Thermococcus sp.]
MYKGIWIHPWDFNGGSISKISHYGFTHASLAVRYIEERQDWPGPNIIFQNPKKRTYTSEENAVYWIPDRERYLHLPPQLRPEPSKEIKEDIVEKFVKACKENSIKSVLWFPTLRWEKAVRDSLDFGVKDIYGSHPSYKRMFLCPSNPFVRETLSLMVEELSEKYEFDEFEFDFIRYPEIPSTHGTPLLTLALSPCFCEYCKAEALRHDLNLEEVRETLKEIVEWHTEYLPNSYYCKDDDYLEAIYLEFTKEIMENELIKKWLKFRAEQIRSLLKELAKIIRKNNPKAQISADLYPPSGAWLLGQDYKKLVEILDAVKIMIYVKPFGKSICRIPYETRIARKYLKDKLLILGLASWPPTTPEDIEEQLKLALDSPIDGVSFYSYGWTPEKNLLKIKEFFERWKT